MTPRQQQCMAAIQELMEQGQSLTYQAISDRVDWPNKSRAFYVVRSLVERGVLVKSAGRWGSIAIASTDAESVPFDRMAAAICAMPANTRSFYGVRDALTKAFAEASA